MNQLCLSPLRRFPGPKLCSISRLPFSWYTATGRKAAWVHRLHLKYGDAVRIAPDEISWTNPEAWSDIYGHPSAQQSGTLKDPRFYGEAANGAQDIIRANFTDHSRFRRGFSHAFSERTMASYEPLLRTQVERLVEGVRSSLAADARRPIDLTQAFDLTTFDVMNEFCFGKPLYMHEKTENHEWMKSLHACAKAVGLFRIARYSPWASMLLPFFVPLSLVRKYRASFRLCAENVNIKMGSLTGDDKNRRDLWSRLVDLPENAQFSREELHANSVIMMLAGAETTATLLTGLVYYLLTCEGPLDKLLTEIRGAFHSASDINFRALSQLPYLQACIDEGLRLFPPVPVGNARLVPPEGRVICGSLIPAKVHILQRNPQEDANLARVDSRLRLWRCCLVEPTEFQPARRVHPRTLAAPSGFRRGSAVGLSAIQLGAQELCGEEVSCHMPR